MSIFKAYDIRGTVPDQFNPEIAEKIGRAFVTFLGCGEVVVGRDVRDSGGPIFDGLAAGITAQGADVIDIGRCDTPMLYFSAQGHPAALMVTASHNPKEYNGIKLCRENAMPISGDTGIKDLERIVSEGSYAPSSKKGKITRADTKTKFIEFTRGFLKVSGGKRIKMVVDGANGAGTLTFPEIFAGLPLDFIPLFMEPDGNFPNHEANPLIDENLRDLQAKVVETGADLGVAIDGDADRCIFVDETGAIHRADTVGSLVALDLMKRHPGATILYDLRSSRAVREAVEAAGGNAIQCRVGHAFIKKQMREHNAAFACELSGHFYFRDHYFTESSAIAAMSIVNLLDAEGKPLSSLVREVSRYSQSGEINFEVRDKDSILKRLETVYPGGRVGRLDGLSVDFDDWWFNVRASNTEPLLRLNLEAPTEAEMLEKKAKIVAIIES